MREEAVEGVVEDAGGDEGVDVANCEAGGGVSGSFEWGGGSKLDG